MFSWREFTLLRILLGGAGVLLPDASTDRSTSQARWRARMAMLKVRIDSSRPAEMVVLSMAAGLRMSRSG
jgi:hypothetical protein